MGTQIRMDKKSPKARQYVKPLSPGKSDWETAMSEFNTAIGGGAEVKAGKTSNDSFFIHIFRSTSQCIDIVLFTIRQCAVTIVFRISHTFFFVFYSPRQWLGYFEIVLRKDSKGRKTTKRF